MYTLEKFTYSWQFSHSNGIDLSKDIEYYYDVYRQICQWTQSEKIILDDYYILLFLLLVEDDAHLGLGRSYASVYRSVLDVVWHFCHLANINEDVVEKLRAMLSSAVDNAPDSQYMTWVEEAIVTKDFLKLQSFVSNIVLQSPYMIILNEDSEVEEELLSSFFSWDEKKIRLFCTSDKAFNWKDKKGLTVLQRLAMVFSERGKTEVANSLQAINAERFRPYKIERITDNKLTLKDSDNLLYENVLLPCLMPTETKDLTIFCQMVRWDDVYYITEPFELKKGDKFEDWEKLNFWDRVINSYVDNAYNSYFDAPNGELVSSLEDYYGMSDDDYFLGEDLDDEDFDDEDDYLDYHHAFDINEEAIKAINSFIAHGNSIDAKSKKATKKKRKQGDRYVPDYTYKPKGKSPDDYFQKKIFDVCSWPDSETKDVCYSLRVLEGWDKQAHTYLISKNYFFACCISSAVIHVLVVKYNSFVREFTKLCSRYKKLLQSCLDAQKQSLQHDEENHNWTDITFKELNMYLSRECVTSGVFDILGYANSLLSEQSEEKKKEYHDLYPDLFKQVKKDKQFCPKDYLPEPIKLPKGIEVTLNPYGDLNELLKSLNPIDSRCLVYSVYQIIKREKKVLEQAEVITDVDYETFESEISNWDDSTILSDNTIIYTIMRLYAGCISNSITSEENKKFIVNTKRQLDAIFFRRWNSSFDFEKLIEKASSEYDDKRKGQEHDKLKAEYHGIFVNKLYGLDTKKLIGFMDEVVDLMKMYADAIAFGLYKNRQDVITFPVLMQHVKNNVMDDIGGEISVNPILSIMESNTIDLFDYSMRMSIFCEDAKHRASFNKLYKALLNVRNISNGKERRQLV